MKPFGWGWLKGKREATRITINFVVDLSDMIDILTSYANQRFFIAEPRVLNAELSRFEVERIVRRHCAQHGEGGFDTGDDLSLSQLRQCQMWAFHAVTSVFPDQYAAAKEQGWL